MARKFELDFVISSELDAEIDDIARAGGISRTDVLRNGLAVLKAFKEQRKLGRRHIGFVSDPSQLDVEITNVL